MSTTHDPRPARWTATLILGAVLAAVLWIVTGEQEMTPLGFVLAAATGR
jgi:hypothetical protein